jgi:hypothetical protein
MVLKQLQMHESGQKPFEETKLLSLQNRKKKYEEEIATFSKPLTDEVCKGILFYYIVLRVCPIQK